MEHTLKHILLSLVLPLTLLHAETTSDLNVSKDHENTFFVRGGFGFSNGTAKIRQKLNEDPAVSLSTEAMVANNLEFVLGYEKYEQNVRFLFNAKLSYDNIGIYEIKNTRYMGGIEGFHSLHMLHLNYGVMFGGGKAIFKAAEYTMDSDLVSFLGLEAYVGADGAISGAFGYFVKLGYEIKGYDSVTRENVSGTTYRDDLVVYNINAGAGVSYRF